MPHPSSQDRHRASVNPRGGFPGVTSAPETVGFPGAVRSSALDAPREDTHAAVEPRGLAHGDPLIVRGSKALLRTVYTDAFPNDWAEAVEVCQRPVTTGRRIGVVSPTGGSGTSTLTAAMAALLASVRSDDVAVLDLCSPPSGLAARLPSDEAGPGLGALRVSSELVSDEVDLTEYGTVPRPRLRRLTYASDDPALDAPAVGALYRGLSRRYAAAVCELPRPDAAPGSMSTYGMHALVIAMSPAPGSIENNCETLRRIRSAEPDVPVLPVLINSRRSSGPVLLRASAALSQTLRDLGHEVPLSRIAVDRHLATGGHLSISRIGEARRLQIAQLTAAALRAASGGRR